MASLVSTCVVPCAYSTSSAAPRAKSCTSSSRQLNMNFSPMIQISKKAAAAAKRSSHCFKTKTTISCSTAQAQAQPETLQIVRTTIAKQLSIDETTVAPQTKFADLGADSLDTVEIMMALEEKFGVSIGEGGAENIATVQDAADLIEKVKAAGSSA